MVKKEDKDMIIKHLTETLDKVNEMLSDLDLYDYGEEDTIKFEDDINKIKDFIWQQKAYVTF